MNTHLHTHDYSRILDAHGNIGEIILQPQRVATNPMLRNYHYGQFGDSSSRGDTLTGTRATRSPERPTAARSRFGQWLLFVGPRSIRRLMTTVIVGLAEHEDVRILDCGDQFDPKLAARLIKGKTEVFDHIKLITARTCAQALYILDHTSISPVPFIGLDLLQPFYEASIDLEERKDMLKGCLQNLRRLQLSTGGMVSLCPPMRGAAEQAGELYGLVGEAAKDTFDVAIIYPGAEVDENFFTP